jgi:hypothetical protein
MKDRPGDSFYWGPPIPLEDSRLPEFPAAALPDWLRDYVIAESRATQTPRSLAGTLVLATAAAATARKVRVLIRSGWEEPVNIFAAVVLDSGNRKTAVFSHVTAPLVEFESQEQERAAPQIRKFLSRRGVLEQRRKDRERKAAKAPAEKRGELEQEVIEIVEELARLPVPLAPRLFADDVTPEKLAGLLHDHGGRFAVLSAEGGVFEVLAGRYSSNSVPNFDVFLKGHAGDPLRVDRIGRPPEHVDRPALTVGLAIQHDVLRGLRRKPGFRGRGLLARFLYAVPTSLVGSRDVNAPPVPTDVAESYRSNMFRLFSAFWDRADESVLPLSPAAQRTLKDFEAKLEPKLDKFGEFGGIADWASKLVGAIGRIAASLHVAERVGACEPWRDPIDADTVENAIQLGTFYLAHAKAAFAEMGADPEVENARHVLAWIARTRVRKFSKREVHQGTRGRFKQVAELRPALAVLMEHRYIRELPKPSDGGPGRAKGPSYAVSPYVEWSSECFEDIEEGSHKAISTSSPSSEEDRELDSSSESPSQNPQYPQNPCEEPDGDVDVNEEVVL